MLHRPAHRLSTGCSHRLPCGTTSSYHSLKASPAPLALSTWALLAYATLLACHTSPELP
jgi:hypothetical protein